MLKNMLSLTSVFISTFLSANIIEITNIDEIRPYIIENGLYLFDIDDTLIVNPFYLGTSPWRQWIRPQLTKYRTDFNLFDGLTYYIAKRAPYQTVQPETSHLITDLQTDGHVALAFTARGRSLWYSSQIENVDQFTVDQLDTVGIDFTKTVLPPQFEDLDRQHFYKNIIFAEHIPKGTLFTQILKNLNYEPSRIIFIDDKLEQIKSMEIAAQMANIPFFGFWYRRVELDFKTFEPMIANVQLEYLLLENKVIQDDVAFKLIEILDVKNPHTYFHNFFSKIDLQNFSFKNGSYSYLLP